MAIKADDLRVTSEVYLAAANDRTNRKVLRQVASRFPSLPRDVAEEAKQNALLRALGQHDPSYGTRFTTSLHEFMLWECKDAARSEGRRRARERPVGLRDADRLTHPEAPGLTHLFDCMQGLDPMDRRVLRQYYFQRMTYREIAEANQCGRTTAHQHVQDAVARLRTICLGEDEMATHRLPAKDPSGIIGLGATHDGSRANPLPGSPYDARPDDFPSTSEIVDMGNVIEIKEVYLAGEGSYKAPEPEVEAETEAEPEPEPEAEDEDEGQGVEVEDGPETEDEDETSDD